MIDTVKAATAILALHASAELRARGQHDLAAAFVTARTPEAWRAVREACRLDVTLGHVAGALSRGDVDTAAHLYRARSAEVGCKALAVLAGARR